jgi:hypothetical protein
LDLVKEIEKRGGLDDLKKALFGVFTTREEFIEKLVQLIVVQNLSFSAVEWEELRALCNLTSYTPFPSRRTITREI